MKKSRSSDQSCLLTELFQLVRVQLHAERYCSVFDSVGIKFYVLNQEVKALLLLG